MAHRRKRKDEARAREGKEVHHDRRRGRMRLAAAAAVLLAVAVVATLMIPPGPVGPREGSRVGEVAPAFTIEDVDGRTIDLLAHRGKVVVLDFMGSRCSSCVLEMPHLVQVYATFRDRDFAMVSIDVGGGLGTEDPDTAREFLEAYGGSWPIALDNQGLLSRYGLVYSLPTLLVVDKGGIVRLNHAGIMTAGDLSTLVESLL